MPPKVSIVFPCYNVERYLDKTLASIHDQDYDNIEVVTVDDASTDGTLRILEEWQAKFRKRGYEMIIARHTENLDVCAGINTGLGLCTGEYLSVPDSDDYLYPENISSFVAALEDNPEYGWAMCDAEIVNDGFTRAYPFPVPRVSVYKNDFHDFLSARTPFNTWMLMARKEYFDRCVGKSIYNSRLTQEWSIVFPLSFYGPYLRVPKTLYRYNKRRNSKAGWINGDLEPVERHNLDLKALGLDVLSTLPLDDGEKTCARLALNLVYGFRLYEARLTRGCATEAIEEELSLLIDGILGPRDGRSSIRLRVEYALDALLGVREEPPLEAYRKGRELFSRGYIIYGAGRICRYLAGGLTDAFGPPAAVWDKKRRDVFEGVAATAPDFSHEKLPVVIAVASGASVAEIRASLEKGGFASIMEVKPAILALRGYELEKRAGRSGE